MELTAKMRLNNDQIAWIEELESGKWKHHTGWLRSPVVLSEEKIEYGYCCLGVFCAMQEGVDWGVTSGVHYPRLGEVELSKLGHYLSDDFARRVDLTPEDMRVIGVANDQSWEYAQVIPLIKRIWRDKGYDC